MIIGLDISISEKGSKSLMHASAHPFVFHFAMTVLQLSL